MPIQVIGSSNFSTIPGSCTSTGCAHGRSGKPGRQRLAWGGTGYSGLRLGLRCSGRPGDVLRLSYPQDCADTPESLAQQVQNPVAAFATDNNGVIIELPAVSGAEASVSGSLIFGIGTQSNNGLGGATVFGTDAFGDFNTTYQNHRVYELSGQRFKRNLIFSILPLRGCRCAAELTFLVLPFLGTEHLRIK